MTAPTFTNRFRAIIKPRYARLIACLAVLCLIVTPARSQQGAGLGTLHGAVRDEQGKAISGAVVSLSAKEGSQTLTANADAQGGYSFSGLRDGVYSLQVSLAGYADGAIPSIFLAPSESKVVDLTLGLAKAPSSKNAAVPQFFDPPQFTVAGVTDTTSLGGHGSDTVVRTREEIAKETTLLGKAQPGVQPVSPADERLLREAADRDPHSFSPNHQFGEALIARGKAREAIPYLERAAAAKAGSYENAYDLVLANADAGNYEKARMQATALLPNHELPNHDQAELHHLLGDIGEHLGNSLEAVREYQRAAELDPGEGYIFDWGSELLLHHAPEPALEVFSKGNHLFPRSARILIGLGAALFSRGSYDQAVQKICEASDLNPDDAAPYLFLAKMVSGNAVPAEALVEKLHRFVTLQPQNAEANYYYALALWNQHKNSSADVTQNVAEIETLLRQAIRVDEKFAAAYLQLGIIHSEQKDFPAAIADYRQAIQVAPRMPMIMEEAHYRLAHAYRETGESEKAKAELQIYEQLARASARQAERERHEIRQFVYTLRDQPPAQVQ
jgi:tetratricopeptide (TPR) repeat protein